MTTEMGLVMLGVCAAQALALLVVSLALRKASSTHANEVSRVLAQADESRKVAQRAVSDMVRLLVGKENPNAVILAHRAGLSDKNGTVPEHFENGGQAEALNSRLDFARKALNRLDGEDVDDVDIRGRMEVPGDIR